MRRRCISHRSPECLDLKCRKSKSFVGTSSEDFAAVIGYRHRVLPLCRKSSILRGYRPAVFLVEFGLPASNVQHRFDGETGAWLQQITDQPIPPSERLGQPVRRDLEEVLMHCLVKDLMDYSRLGSDKDIELVDCKNLVLGVKDDLSKLIEDKGGQLVIGELPKVHGYKTSLRLLFQNLINNAMKFQNPDISPLVEIFYKENKNFWEFGVKDNGIGIEDQHKEKIFSIFKRLHSRNEYEGTGIGLAHCQKITEMHGGTIRVTSEPNKGSTFYFTLAKGSGI